MEIAATIGLAVVVTISNGDLSPDIVNRAVAEADTIWRDAGVAIEWHRNGEPTLHSIVVRFVDDHGHAGARQVAMAWIDVVGDHPVPEIYISRSNALALFGSAHLLGSELAPVPAATTEIVGRALGRAMAHEIGHYLFASRGHDPKGLMATGRAPLEMFGVDRRPFLLTPGERLRLSQVVERERLHVGGGSPLHAVTVDRRCGYNSSASTPAPRV